MPTTQWLTADIIPIVADRMDYKSYIRFLSTCKLTKTYLSPKRAAVVYPHALEHIVKLICNERIATADPDFTYERKVCNLLVYSTPRISTEYYKSYFQFRINDLDATKPKSVSIIVNRRKFFTRYIEYNVDMGTTIAIISPSFEKPMQSGIIELEEQVMEDEFEKTKTVAYNDGFHSILHDLACTMCPLN